jgi:hypothetical protein
VVKNVMINPKYPLGVTFSKYVRIVCRIEITHF